MLGEIDALLRTRHALPFWARYSRAVRVGFFAPNARLDVYHGLGTTPDGMFVVWGDSPIVAVPGIAWTDTVASLQASAANAHAVLLFYTLREEPERGASAENVGKYTPAYVEGTPVNFTPTVGGSSVAGSQTYTTQAGVWWKVGRTVSFTLYVALASKGGTMSGVVGVGGPPYPITSVNPNGYVGFALGNYGGVTHGAGYSDLGAYGTPGGTSLTINFAIMGSAVATGVLQVPNISNTFSAIVSGSYLTD